MIDKKTLTGIIGQAKAKGTKKKFKQSVELYVMLDSHRVKAADININETVALPNRPGNQPTVCVIASGELGMRAKRAGADAVIAVEEMDRLATNKKDAKKVSKAYDFFMADTSLMPRIGKTLGPFLGPKGKMPLPITLNSPIDQMLERLRGSIRSRTRAHSAISCKIGEEDTDDDKLAANALAVLESLERKIPNGLKVARRIGVKLTMGPLESTTDLGE
ncbi:MAG: 50S ribosomal protein L1 [Nitrososphaerota archaeon]|nr:50S ribosomal protein L1 [Nitrososphaerota archaeon]